MTGVADSTQDQEKAHWEGGAGVKEGVGVLEDGGGAGVKEGVGVLEDGGGAGVRRGVGMCENEGEERMMKLRGQTVSGTTTGENMFCVYIMLCGESGSCINNAHVHSCIQLDFRYTVRSSPLSPLPRDSYHQDPALLWMLAAQQAAAEDTECGQHQQ